MRSVLLLCLAVLHGAPAIAQDRLVLSPDRFEETPGGSLFAEAVTVGPAGLEVAVEALDYLNLTAVIFRTSDGAPSLPVSVLRNERAFHAAETGTGPITFQTRMTGTLRLSVDNPSGTPVESSLAVFVGPMTPPFDPDFTTDLNGDPLPAGESSAAVPETCTVEGGGVASDETLGASPEEVEAAKAQEKALRDQLEFINISATTMGPAALQFANLALGTVAPAPPGMPGLDVSGGTAVLGALPAMLAPEAFQCREALVSIPALPRIPVSCPMSLRAGNDCYDAAYTKIESARLGLARLDCVYAAGKHHIELLLAGMAGAANMGGPAAPILKMRTEQERKSALGQIKTIANDQKGVLMGRLREGLQDLGRCEAEYGDFPGWYARVGFAFESGANAAHTYK